jgi:homoserine/homoserine lactone efflux protein
VDWSVWLMFAVTDGALCVTPGPAVLLVVSQGLRRGATQALWSAAGVLSANALYFAISGTGVGALLVASGTSFIVVKWDGAAYLFYLGALAILRPSRPAGPQAIGVASDSGPWPLFAHGFVLQISNPKALLFFVSILPQFIDRTGSIVMQILVLGVTSIVLEFVVLAAYGAVAARAARYATEPRFAAATSRLSGVLLVGAALGLLRLGR